MISKLHPRTQSDYMFQMQNVHFVCQLSARISLQTRKDRRLNISHLIIAKLIGRFQRNHLKFSISIS